MLVLVTAGAAILFTRLTLLDPHGQWDAWAIWNLRARFLWRAGPDWAQVFTTAPGWSHPDYPLLLPLSVVRLWWYAGIETTMGPALLAALFTCSTVALLVSALWVVAGSTAGILGGLALIGLPAFVVHGASQYADTPLGFFILASVTLVCLRHCLPAPPGAATVLAGVAAGLAAWTKNEGVLFAVALLVSTGVVAAQRAGPPGAARELGLLGCGLLPVLSVVLAFKAWVSLGSGQLAGATRGVGVRVLDLGRYWEVALGLRRGLIALGDGALFGPAWLLVLYLALVGVRPSALARLETRVAVLALGLVLGGYAAAYVVTPVNLRWHLDASASRLWLHLWPSLVFLCFLLGGRQRLRAAPGQSGTGSE
jgi:hypothetical protein